MKKICILLAVCLGLAAVARAEDAAAPKAPADSSGWESLFAADLSNAEFPKGVWTCEDGVMTASEDQCIWSQKSYENFALDLEFKTAAGTNSGVIVYCSNMQDWIPNSIEIQIADDSAPQWANSPKTWQCAAVFGHLAAETQRGQEAGRVESDAGRVQGTDHRGGAQRPAGQSDRSAEVDLGQAEPRRERDPGMAQPPAGRIAHQGQHRAARQTRRGPDLLPQREDQEARLSVGSRAERGDAERKEKKKEWGCVGSFESLVTIFFSRLLDFPLRPCVSARETSFRPLEGNHV